MGLSDLSFEQLNEFPHILDWSAQKFIVWKPANCCEWNIVPCNITLILYMELISRKRWTLVFGQLSKIGYCPFQNSLSILLTFNKCGSFQNFDRYERSSPSIFGHVSLTKKSTVGRDSFRKKVRLGYLDVAIAKNLQNSHAILCYRFVTEVI